jgi:hypothetical protein
MYQNPIEARGKSLEQKKVSRGVEEGFVDWYLSYAQNRPHSAASDENHRELRAKISRDNESQFSIESAMK